MEGREKVFINKEPSDDHLEYIKDLLEDVDIKDPPTIVNKIKKYFYKHRCVHYKFFCTIKFYNNFIYLFNFIKF